MWKWNPKTKGSGIVTCIPQKGRCPNNCSDCFFQSGRSYLEPLEENLPHIPTTESKNRIVRINDGNDSNVNRPRVEMVAQRFDKYFFNTAIPKALGGFSAPIVLTVNPANLTDNDFVKLEEIPPNLMFVRIRTCVWNLGKVVTPAVEYYSSREVPIVLTFMAYFTNQIPTAYELDYIFRKRTLNSYWAITTGAWRAVMKCFEDNVWVYSCGKIEGEKGNTKCSRCGNCIREYYNAMERLRKDSDNGDDT